jgi:hypothetical protein
MSTPVGNLRQPLWVGGAEKFIKGGVVMFKQKKDRVRGAIAALVWSSLLLPALAWSNEVTAASPVPLSASADWWHWPVILLGVTFVMGILAVLGGVGGGVLFVPIISGFFPFHLDFVRGTGLLVALCGALAAGPGLLKANLASLRLAMPVALIASTMAIVGAMVGLALPTHIVQLSLGATILGIVVIMLIAKKSEVPDVPEADSLSAALRICGVYYDHSNKQTIDWKIHRTIPGLRRHGRNVRFGCRVGQCAGSQPDDGRPPEDQCCHQQVPSFHYGHLRGLDLSEQRMRYPDDGSPFIDWHHVGLFCRGSIAQDCQTYVYSLDGYCHFTFRWNQGLYKRAEFHGYSIKSEDYDHDQATVGSDPGTAPVRKYS